MGIDRRKLITGGLVSAGVAAAGTLKSGVKAPKSAQFIDDWIIPHGGDCCGCIISEDVGNNEYRLVCNECGERVDVLVSEITYNRMAEALMRAQHALSFAHGHMAHDSKPEHSYDLDFSKELQFIDEILKAAKVDPRTLDPLT